MVAELHRQAFLLDVDFEIIVADDCSDNLEIKVANRTIKEMQGVRLIELDQNMGRAAVRNFLADSAVSETLIFLDCDTFPVSERFLYNYNMSKFSDIVVGGLAYRDDAPDAQFSLRWHYGHLRESKVAKIRMQKPYASFMTGNFMIKKAVFEHMKFDESIAGYGHEDTLFGITLKREGVAILHIDNPVYHEGLEPNEVFLEKTKTGIQNLKTILSKKQFNKELADQITLVKWYNRVKRTGFSRLFGWCFLKFENKLILMLQKEKPNLKIFDLFKLGYLCSITKDF